MFVKISNNICMEHKFFEVNFLRKFKKFLISNFLYFLKYKPKTSKKCFI